MERKVEKEKNVEMKIGKGDKEERINKIEKMGWIDEMVIGRKKEFMKWVIESDEGFKNGIEIEIGINEMMMKSIGVGNLKVVEGILMIGLKEKIKIGEFIVELEKIEIKVIEIVKEMKINGKKIKKIGKLKGKRRKLNEEEMMEIGEMRELNEVEKELKEKKKGEKSRDLKVVLKKEKVMKSRVEEDGIEGKKIKIMKVWRRRIDEKMIMIIMMEKVRILEIEEIFRKERRMKIGRIKGIWKKRKKSSRRMESKGEKLNVVRLKNGEKVLRKVIMESKDKKMKGKGGVNMWWKSNGKR